MPHTSSSRDPWVSPWLWFLLPRAQVSPWHCPCPGSLHTLGSPQLIFWHRAPRPWTHTSGCPIVWQPHGPIHAAPWLEQPPVPFGHQPRSTRRACPGLWQGLVPVTCPAAPSIVSTSSSQCEQGSAVDVDLLWAWTCCAHGPAIDRDLLPCIPPAPIAFQPILTACPALALAALGLGKGICVQ